MCGITGFAQISKTVSQDTLNLMCNQLDYRGPDDSGIYVSDLGNVGFGHRRLAFLDLSQAGHQPMCSENGTWVIVFNGEIYNYRELRTELAGLGWHFKTHSDTEVILAGYSYWGKKMPARLRGMFAFSIYDKSSKTLFLCRDRFGIKPLYYSCSDHLFLFGSEVKSILIVPGFEKRIRKESVSLFLANRYVPTPYTMWDGIFKLPPASWLEVDINTMQLKHGKYWKLEAGNLKYTNEDHQQNVEELLRKSVAMHLRSDVQIGSFLSGGMDSSVLVQQMVRERYSPIDVFSIGFKGWENSEHRYAEMVSSALGVEQNTLMLDRISLDSVSHLMYHYDDPIADISILPTYAVCGLAAGKVKAVLSGEGADECFGGYWWHKPKSFQKTSLWVRLKEMVLGTDFERVKSHYIQAMSMGLFSAQELQKALGHEWQSSIPQDPFAHFDAFKLKGISPVKQLQFLDINTFMPELILAKVDRASMAHSLEVRVPFLDHPLVEYLFSLDESLYMETGIQKKNLRQMLKGNVPNEVFERPKQGFVGPDKFYEDFEGYSHALENGVLVKDGIIKREYISALLLAKDHWRLWKIFVLQNWWLQWVV